ncbi:MAG TPA: glycosyltransferase 87 family protein [Coriobacteriia bacterium]
MTRFDPRRAPAVVLVLAPLVLLALLVGLTSEPTRLIFGSDLAVYRRYGLQVLGGSIPYLDFKVEYPPLALVPMTVPLLAAPAGGIDDLGYIWRFVAVQGALAVAAGWLLFQATGRSRSTLVLWAVLVGFAWASVALRYDLWPVLCVLVAVLVVDRRPGAAGVALGLGTMLKLYPLALLPVLGAYALAGRDRAGFVRLVVGCASIVGIVMAAAWVLAGPASLQWLVYQQDRGLQIESLGAGLVLGLHVLVGQPLDVAYGFGSIQVRGPGSDLLVAASPVALAALLGFVTAVAAMRFRRDYARLGRVPTGSVVIASAAAVAAILVGSKVLSVQYVIWLLPFAILLPVRMRWLLLAVTALSTAIYTIDYTGLLRLETPVIAALLVRNVLLAVIAAWLVVEMWTGRGSARDAIAGPSDGALQADLLGAAPEVGPRMVGRAPS